MLIDSTYVIRIVEFLHSEKLAIPVIDKNVRLYLDRIVNNLQYALHQESLRCFCRCKTYVLKLFAFVCALVSTALFTNQQSR